MGVWASTASLFREVGELVRLQDAAARAGQLVAYSEDISTWSMIGGYLEALHDATGRAYVYVTSAPDDPMFAAPRPGMRAHFVSRAVPYWMPRLDAPALLTTMPDLARLHIGRPPPTTAAVYAFHSLNSIHEVYREGAFDHYDVFFCAGPHHRVELESRFAQLGRPCPRLEDVGYPKLDRLAARYRDWTRKDTRTTILVAPSWGPGNLLEAYGVDVVRQLRATGARVIVRPHPCFWLPIYPRGREYVQRVIDAFADDADVTIERTINSEESFFESDLLVSDFSGAAFEFALGTQRPVLYLDGARKTLNPNWTTLGLPTFEDTRRFDTGVVVKPDRLSEVGASAELLLRDATAWSDRLAALRAQLVFNPGASAAAGAAVLDHLLSA